MTSPILIIIRELKTGIRPQYGDYVYMNGRFRKDGMIVTESEVLKYIKSSFKFLI